MVETIYIFAEQTTTDGKRFLLGYELGEPSPSTRDVVVLEERKDGVVMPLRR